MSLFFQTGHFLLSHTPWTFSGEPNKWGLVSDFNPGPLAGVKKESNFSQD